MNIATSRAWDTYSVPLQQKDTALNMGVPPLLLTPGPLPPTVPIRLERRAQPRLHFAANRAAQSPKLNLEAYPPDPNLIEQFGANLCLRNGILPWRQNARVTIVAISDAQQETLVRSILPAHLPPAHVIQMAREEIETALLVSAGPALAELAETRVREEESWRGVRWPRPLFCLVGLMCLLTPAFWFPHQAFAFGLAMALLALGLSTCLKITAGLIAWRAAIPPVPPPRPEGELPVISLLVPLFHETQIAAQLLARLTRLDYPRTKLDIILIVEELDFQTRALIGKARLPDWIRVITVPPGTVQTKPRALNFALEFCRGSLVGVYDAEDAPEPSQLRKVAAHFAQSPPDVACLQGALNFYNMRFNWLSRFFSIEYATWFHVVLPGLQKLRLPVPLGGTTMFFRRDILEELGGWDAHNVTEDADLGIRLARYGYQTELIETTTQEEAVCRFWPWIRQRSRWLKGYAVTWLVHNRKPFALWRDLGTWQFLGVQIIFLGTLLQFFLAPLLWSLWLLLFGWSHPLADSFGSTAITVLSAFLLFSALVEIFVSGLALAKSGRNGLMARVPFMMFYMPMATLAVYRGLWDLGRRPFFWDKTMHGVSAPDTHL
jgi:cellulose synthase/poly-beta-1,6-N-acetylglucosamine synthase-like glycosyltransferase